MNFFFFNKKEKSILQNQCNPLKTTVVVEAPLLWLVGILFSCFYNNVKKKTDIDYFIPFCPFRRLHQQRHCRVLP